MGLNTFDFYCLFSSEQFSCSVMSDSLQHPALQQTWMQDFSVHHQFPAFAQIHVHWVSDTIQPTQPLLSPSAPAFNFFQHQGLF